MSFGVRLTAQLAQSAGQFFALFAPVELWRNVHELTIPFTLLLMVALALPFRSSEGDREKALANFGSGFAVWGIIGPPIPSRVLWSIMGAPHRPLLPVEAFLLCATAMYMSAGGFFWVANRDQEAA